ncbi:hypothetical protein ACS0TY_033205 [Phlomoides rotata]
MSSGGTSKNHELVWHAFLKRASNRYTDLMNSWIQKWESKSQFRPEGINEAVWLSYTEYWSHPEVVAKREQCRANRLSQPGGEGTGPSHHRASAKSQLERALEFRERVGMDPTPYELAMMIHGPRGPDGSYTYPKMETIPTEVHQESEQMSQ